MCTQIDGRMKLVKAGPSVVERLRSFRQSAEADKMPLIYPVPLVLVLADLCKLFGLSDSERREVLGRFGEGYVQKEEATPIRLLKSANGRRVARPVRKR